MTPRVPRGPCPLHGTKFLEIIERSFVCLAPTPDDEFSKKCWYHIPRTGKPRGVKLCPDCKKEGKKKKTEITYTYCPKHSAIRGKVYRENSKKKKDENKK